MLRIWKQNVASRCNQSSIRGSAEDQIICYPSMFQNFKISWDPFRAKDEEQASTTQAPLQQFVFVQISTNSRKKKREREEEKRREKTRQRRLEKILRVSLADK